MPSCDVSSFPRSNEPAIYINVGEENRLRRKIEDLHLRIEEIIKEYNREVEINNILLDKVKNMKGYKKNEKTKSIPERQKYIEKNETTVAIANLPSTRGCSHSNSKD